MTPEEKYYEMKQQVQAGKHLIRWAKILVKQGKTFDLAWEETISSCQPLPSEEWINLAKSVFFSEIR